MSEDRKSTASLEDEAAQQRARLAVVLNALSDATSGVGGANPVEAVSKAASAIPGSVVDTALDLAKRNPLAVSLLAAGAAALVFGATSRPTEETDPEPEKIKRTPFPSGDDIGEPTSARLMRQNLGAGLDQLDAEARVRVVNARLQAIAAQESLETEGEPPEHEDGGQQKRAWWIGLPVAAGIAGALAGGWLMRGKRAERDPKASKTNRSVAAPSDRSARG